MTDDHVELRVTLGLDAMNALLAHAGYPPEKVAETTRALQPGLTVEQDVSLAPHLFVVQSGAETVAAERVVTEAKGLEVDIVLIYPRPAASRLGLHLTLYEAVPELTKSVITLFGSDGRSLGMAVLRHDDATISLPLLPVARPEAAPVAGSAEGEVAAVESLPSPGISLGEFFRLGVEHILIGLDHLLFLAALLLGVRSLKSMLVVISCFTLAHTLTLALAALDLFTLPDWFVEPFIAASIIFVCLDSLLRRDHEADRWWLAGLFGLVHGFGFAAILREMGLGPDLKELVSSLLAFNLGVEAGQVMLAALVLPLLLWARRHVVWSRYGAPALTCAIIAISVYWVVERLGGAAPGHG